jgi:putative membrane protein
MITEASLVATPTTVHGAVPSVAASTLANPLVGVRRPAYRLFFYYLLQSLLAGPFLVFVIPVRWFRFRTLRYTFDAEGVTVRWGILFRREVSLTYARIQDIHLVSNIVERWLGLGRVQIQTASGSADAEMTIEGFRDYEAVRDELYRRMRGARGRGATHTSDGVLAGQDVMNDVVTALNAAVEELRALREAVDRKGIL